MGLGGVLEQAHETKLGVWEPMAFRANKQNWAPFDKEVCAMHKSIKEFEVTNFGCPSLTIFTDHKAIIKVVNGHLTRVDNGKTH